MTSGEVKVSLNYGDIPIVDETLDLCDLVTQINDQCPLKKGPFSIHNVNQTIPDYVPSVSIAGSCDHLVSIYHREVMKLRQL